VFAPLDRLHARLFTVCALHPQHNLLGGLGLLVEDRLGLTSISSLFAVISPLPLREKRGFSSLVLGDFHGHVLLASLAERLLGLRYINHFGLAYKSDPCGRERLRSEAAYF